MESKNDIAHLLQLTRIFKINPMINLPIACTQGTRSLSYTLAQIVSDNSNSNITDKFQFKPCKYVTSVKSILT